MSTAHIRHGIGCVRPYLYGSLDLPGFLAQAVDAAYERAIEAGATSIAPPEDKPYEERSAGIKDPSGNTWWVSTYRG